MLKKECQHHWPGQKNGPGSKTHALHLDMEYDHAWMLVRCFVQAKKSLSRLCADDVPQGEECAHVHQ